jgi:tripeptidyl-peptidase I
MLVSLFFLTLFFHEALGLSRRFLVHTVLEERKAIPHGWNKRGLSDSSAFNKKSLILPLRINLRQNNLHRAEELLLDVSSPKSKNFGKHYTPNQVVDLFAPTEDSVATVMGWLMDAGFKGVYSKVKGVRISPSP